MSAVRTAGDRRRACWAHCWGLGAGRVRAVRSDAGRRPPRSAARWPRYATAGAVVIGYRESSVPFSFLSPRKEPIGYSIELCKAVVEAMGDAVQQDAWRSGGCP